MKIKSALILSMLSFFIGNYCFLIQAMEEPTGDINEGNLEAREDIFLGLIKKPVLDFYEMYGVKALADILLLGCSEIIRLMICKTIFDDVHQRAVVMDILLYAFIHDNSDDLKFNMYLIDLFYQSRAELDEDTCCILHEIYENLLPKLKKIAESEKNKLDTSIVLDSEAKKIIENFNNFRALEVGRLYVHPQKDTMKEFPEEDLK